MNMGKSYEGVHEWMVAFREQVSTSTVCEFCHDLDDEGITYSMSVDDYGLTVWAMLTVDQVYCLDEYEWALSTIADMGCADGQ